MEELKPCPFCGSEAEVSYIAWNIIQCTCCSCQLIVLPVPEGATPDYAIRVWNKRADPCDGCEYFSTPTEWKCEECSRFYPDYYSPKGDNDGK